MIDELEAAWKLLIEKTNGEASVTYDTSGLGLNEKKGIVVHFSTTIDDLYLKGRGMYTNSLLDRCTFEVRSSLPRGFFLRVYPADLASSLARLLGAQDIKTGDQEFDNAFMVKSNHPELTLLVLDDEIRKLITSAPGSFRIHQGMVTFSSKPPPFEELPERFVNVVNALGLLGRKGKALLQPWTDATQGVIHGDATRTHPQQTYFSIEWPALIDAEKGGRSWVEFEAHDIPIKVEAIFKEEELSTQLQTRRCAIELGQFAIEKKDHQPREVAPLVDGLIQELREVYHLYALEPGLLMRVLTPELQRELAAYSFESLYSNGEETSLSIKGLIQEPERLQKAAMILATFSSIVSQPYR